MIQYPISEPDLLSRIDSASATWQTRAQGRTNAFIQLGRYEEAGNIWGEIKGVYMDLQHCKCGFCERWLAHKEFGPVEHDVEHFRPKSYVKAFPPASTDSEAKERHRQLSYDFSTGGACTPGYFRLAYHPLNYLTACKECNSSLKDNYFPIASTRNIGASHPSNLISEQPFLIYPIGTLDVDPETLIAFDGITAIPKSTDPFLRRRAKVTIDLLQLNGRETLRRERAKIIPTLHLALLTRNDDRELVREESEHIINKYTSVESNHTNCSRCFVQLFESNPTRAAEFSKLAKRVKAR